MKVETIHSKKKRVVLHNALSNICMKVAAHTRNTVKVVTDVCGVVVTEKTLGLVLCCSLLSSLSLCNLSYSSRISAGVLFLSTTYTASPQGIGNEDYVHVKNV